jgi:hypothetical protein
MRGMKTRIPSKRISRLAAALLSAAVLGSALAPAGFAASQANDGVRAKATSRADDKCRQIKNKKKRKQCIAKHEGANHH